MAHGNAHELLDISEVFGADLDDAKVLDPALLPDSETICQTLHQICELEQQQQLQQQQHQVQLQQEHKRVQDDTALFDWIKAEDDSLEIRQAELCSMEISKTVEDALYGDDDDEPDHEMGQEPIKAEVAIVHPQPITDAKDLLTDAELPNILDMFTSMYAESQPSDAESKYNPLSIHIPAPITIPKYQAMQPPTVTYQNTRLIAPHSTPNIHFNTSAFFNQPTQSPCKPLTSSSTIAYPTNSFLSPQYHGHLAARISCPKSRTPKALPRFTLSPDIAEQKLNRIFFQYCDPVTKSLSLDQLMTMLTKHRIKEDTPLNLSVLFPPNEATTSINPFPYSLFQDKNDTITMETFQNAFQICNRCTEMKRKQQHILSKSPNASGSSQGQELVEDVAPVIVRVVPTTYEGPKIKSCDHFQWTWCEGFDKTGNEKCNGTNRHDKCPKYLANCTLWKHRLPPKNRKSKGPEDMDSPAKKLKFFS